MCPRHREPFLHHFYLVPALKPAPIQDFRENLYRPPNRPYSPPPSASTTAHRPTCPTCPTSLTPRPTTQHATRNTPHATRTTQHATRNTQHATPTPPPTPIH